ncbi:hypothetical protein QWZ16_21930 [Vibrio ostreicida]|uniref:Secreted protein n=1 Tax=Vibrio ostreicida TaxID=526588 RepID=A0ABT8BYZ6_9VIBR|nr:hypothetical protein [Vibrio ostreicida]MDN3611138.1 hypothetical protein [Vibrio ostreicida]MDN3612258.1 hypothetical protein [Vibrio ostreicida]
MGLISVLRPVQPLVCAGLDSITARCSLGSHGGDNQRITGRWRRKKSHNTQSLWNKVTIIRAELGGLH